jgi:hypothetical protein
MHFPPPNVENQSSRATALVSILLVSLRIVAAAAGAAATAAARATTTAAVTPAAAAAIAAAATTAVAAASTTTAIASATAAAAVTTASTTTAAAETTAASASFSRASFVDDQRSSTYRSPIQDFDGILCLFIRRHLDEAETARLAAVSVRHYLRRHNLARFREHFLQRFLRS